MTWPKAPTPPAVAHPGVGDHLVIGSTLDDALGEAYDKVARLLGLPIGGGGGPALEALAREGSPDAVPLPVPMQRKKSYDFSFAGLKTAVRLAVQRAPEEARATRMHVHMPMPHVRARAHAPAHAHAHARAYVRAHAHAHAHDP